MPVLSVQEIEFQTREGRPAIDDLFFYTSLKCNKTCHHCFVSSSPTNNTLDDLTIADVQPLLEEAGLHGVQNIYLTGGEPFLISDALAIIEAASDVAPITIYTNASRPLERKLEGLAAINRRHLELHGRPILLRVSFDHYSPDIHDVFYGRGDAAFEESIQTAISAARLGFHIAVTSQKDIHNNGSDSLVEKMFRDLFAEHDIELRDVKVLPEIPTGQQASRAANRDASPVSPAEFEMSGTPLSSLMCHVGRTILKYKGRTRVYPCTLIVPDHPDAIKELEGYAMGETLAESFGRRQPLDFVACRAYCVQGRMTCGN